MISVLTDNCNCFYWPCVLRIIGLQTHENKRPLQLLHCTALRFPHKRVKHKLNIRIRRLIVPILIETWFLVRVLITNSILTTANCMLKHLLSFQERLFTDRFLNGYIYTESKCLDRLDIKHKEVVLQLRYICS